MSEDDVLTKEDLEHIAKAAGVKLTPENRDGIISNLQDLRAGIIQKEKMIPPDTTPITIFDARWGD